MDAESKSYVESIVIGYLTQNLKEFPSGVPLAQFERTFPKLSDEADDWYKQYGHKSTMSVLQAINSDTVKVGLDRYNNHVVRLNMQSNKVDRDLVDLVQNQKSAAKKRRGPVRSNSRAAMSSFSLNRQYSNNWSSKQSTPFRLNQDRRNYSDSYGSNDKRSPSTDYQSYRSSQPSNWKSSRPLNSNASQDPRVNSRSSSFVPPQVKPSSYSSSKPTSHSSPSVKYTSSRLPTATRTSSDTHAKTAQSSNTKPPSPTYTSRTQSTPEQLTKKKDSEPLAEKQQTDDPELIAKRSQLRQRLTYLLTTRHQDIKLIHLNCIYKQAFDESLDPKVYGYKSITTLLKDSEIKQCAELVYTTGMPILRSKTPNNKNKSSDDKENSEDQSKPISALKLNAIEPFNFKTMASNLEIAPIRIEPQLGDLAIEEPVKYKTLRLIHKAENSSLAIDDWQAKFEEDYSLRIRISDYGCRTMLEFFYKLARDLPIKVVLRKNNWLAVFDQNAAKTWLDTQLADGHYRAICAFEARYENMAFPDDVYIYMNPNSNAKTTFSRMHLDSIRSSNFTFPERSEGLLAIEERMNCYRDYHKQGFFTIYETFVKPGLPCAAFDHIQQRWCRALVTGLPSTVNRNMNVRVLLVDYGIEKEIPFTMISGLLKELVRIPVGLVLTSDTSDSAPTAVPVVGQSEAVAS